MAAAIGLQGVRDMSLWEFMAAVDGWMAAHCPDDGKSLSSKERDALEDWILDA